MSAVATNAQTYEDERDEYIAERFTRIAARGCPYCGLAIGDDVGEVVEHQGEDRLAHTDCANPSPAMVAGLRDELAAATTKWQRAEDRAAAAEDHRRRLLDAAYVVEDARIDHPAVRALVTLVAELERESRRA